MCQNAVQTVLLSILTSIITGGFIIVFVEIGNRKNRENDKHDQIMMPFMHKLSAVLRFICWCSSRIVYPNEMNANEDEFKKLMNVVGGYGGRLIVSGGDFGVNYFSAEQIEIICKQINNIWYYHDKMKPCRLKLGAMSGIQDFIEKELLKINLTYYTSKLDIDLISKVSGNFYTDIYQPIEYETYKHEVNMAHFQRQYIIVAIAVAFVLISLLSMLFLTLPVCVMRLIGIVVIGLLVLSLMLLGIDMNEQIRFIDSLKIQWQKIRNSCAFLHRKGLNN